MNGYEVAQRVHEKPALQRPHLIAVTGYGMESDKQKARDVGIDNYLVKPVDADQLHEILSRIVETSN
jgi:CheY-like chemotaxis protein